MILSPGATSISVTVQIVNDAGIAVTGLTHTGWPPTCYQVTGGTQTAITLTDLPSQTAAWSSGGVYENGLGYYRLDVPNAAVASAANGVVICGEASGLHIINVEPIQVANVPANTAQINGVSTSSVTTINANQGTTQPINFSGTGTSAYIKSDTEQLNAQTVTAAAGVTFPTSVASPTNITAATGITVATNGDKTGYSLSQAFPANFSSLVIDGSGRVNAFLIGIITTVLTEGATGRLATAWQKAWNVLSSVWTSADVNQTGDSYGYLGTNLGATGANATSLAPAATALSTAQWTSARAGYLDNLNIGGAVASQSSVNAITTSSSRAMILQTAMQYGPDESYTIQMDVFNVTTGSHVNADSTPTLTATGSISGSLAANLGAATNPATGVYRWTYTNPATPTLEQIRFDGSETTNSLTYTMSVYTQTVDSPTAQFTSTDKANLTAIYNKLPTNNIADETLVLAAIGSPMQAGSHVQLATTQDQYAPSKAGDAMALTTGERSTLAGVVRDVSNTSPAANSFGAAVNSAASSASTAATNASTIYTYLQAKFNGMTSLAQWLGLIAGKQSPNSTAQTEINATGAGSGTYDATTDSLEALKDAGVSVDATSMRAALGMAAANMDTQLGDILAAAETSSGTGGDVVTITVTDGTNPIQGAYVFLTINASKYSVQTDVNGIGALAPNEGAGHTYGVAITASGYQFTPTTLVVTGTMSHTYAMTAISITPSPPPTTTCYIYVTSLSPGSVLSGIPVTLSLASFPKGSTGIGIAGRSVTVETDSSGLAEFPGVAQGINYTCSIAGGHQQSSGTTGTGSTTNLASTASD